MNLFELNCIGFRRGSFRFVTRSCALEQGKIYAVTGPNGSGKSSLLNILSLMQVPESGALVYKGRAVDHTDRNAVLEHRRRLAYQLQNPYLFNLSVADNVAYGLKLRRVPVPEIKQRTGEILGQLRLDHLAGRNARRLSGGEAQRTALARTLIQDADAYLLDEPTANVDRENVGVVEEAVLALNREQGKTVVVTTHSSEQAFRLSRDIVPVINGTISEVAYENVFSGTLQACPEGVKAVMIDGGLTVLTDAGERGPVRIAIDPEDILISAGELASSALNRFEGTITRVEQINGSLRIFADAGIELCARITARSYHDLGLNIGTKVWLTFKANAVKLI